MSSVILNRRIMIWVKVEPAMTIARKNFPNVFVRFRKLIVSKNY